jgi:hypothetical protein
VAITVWQSRDIIDMKGSEVCFLVASMRRLLQASTLTVQARLVRGERSAPDAEAFRVLVDATRYDAALLHQSLTLDSFPALGSAESLTNPA